MRVQTKSCFPSLGLFLLLLLFLNLAAQFRWSAGLALDLWPTKRDCQELRIKRKQRIAKSQIAKSQLQASSQWLQQIKEKCFMLGGLRTIKRQHIVIHKCRALRLHDRKDRAYSIQIRSLHHEWFCYFILHFSPHHVNMYYSIFYCSLLFKFINMVRDYE